MHIILSFVFCFFFFKQKTAYEMRISDWSSDVCSSDLASSGAAASSPVVTVPLVPSVSVASPDIALAPAAALPISAGAVGVTLSMTAAPSGTVGAVAAGALTSCAYADQTAGPEPLTIAATATLKNRKSAVRGKRGEGRCELGGG